MSSSKDIDNPIGVSCFSLDILRAQAEQLGEMVVSDNRPLIPARRALIEALAPGTPIRLATPTRSEVEVPWTTDPFAKYLISESRKEALNGACWWRSVGCVLGDPVIGQVVARTHNGPVGRGRFCQGLGVTPREVIKLLKPGERLEACTGRHAESFMGDVIRKQNLRIEELVVGLSLEPCDQCAHIITGWNPKAVYIDSSNGVYYSPLGIKLLQLVEIPVFFVENSEGKR